MRAGSRQPDGSELCTDDHPHADIRAGQRFVRDVFTAFARSKHWRRGAFVLEIEEGTNQFRYGSGEQVWKL